MKTQHITRTALLSAAVLFATSLAASGQASLLTSEGSDGVGHSVARHFGPVQSAPTLERMLEPFNFRDVDSAAYFIGHNAVAEQLAGRGLSRTVGGFVSGQQTETWYSVAEDRSVLCVGGPGSGRYSQAVYVMPGKIRRADVVPVP